MMSANTEIDNVEDCCEIDGLALDGMSPECQLTQFDNVACCTTVVRGTHPTVNPLHTTDTKAVTDIVEYLSRPWFVTTGTFNNASPSLPWTMKLNVSTYYSKNPNWPKTANVYGMRASVCFKLQILATPQHSGIYRLVFQPMTGERINLANTLQMSYLPYAQMNLCESTEVTLKIPYVHPDTYMVRNSSAFSLGTVGLWSITPTGFATGELPPRYRIWSWLEDVELIGSTSTNAQVFLSQSGVKTKVKTSNLVQKPITSHQKPSASDKEIQAAKLSSILQAGSNTAKFLGSMIPAISGFAGSTQWALSYAANLAYSFGWSKPKDHRPVSQMFRSINTGQHNVDGSSICHTLSLLKENSLAIAPLGGTDVDEMALAYILTQQGISSRFTFTAQTSGTDLYTFLVCPNTMRDVGTGSHSGFFPGSGTFTPVTALYYANEFTFWRGTIRVRLTAALTKFHSGRLLVGFVPQTTTSVTPATTDSLNYKSVIWDMRDNPNLEFDIPFIYPRPYARNNEWTGVFFVRVLDTLVAPLNVSPNVTVLVELAAGADFECSRPTIATLIPVGPTPASLAREEDSFVSQSGFKVFKVDERSPADLCIGEAILSVKQLISRATFISAIGTNTSAVLSNINTTTDTKNNIINKWKACYTFWRGSYDYHLIPNDNAITITASYPVETTTYDSPLSNIVVTEQTGLHVTLPFYTDVPMASATTAAINDVVSFRLHTSMFSSESSNQVAIFGHAGEDTQYFYFIGPPTVESSPTFTKPAFDQFNKWASRQPPVIPTQVDRELPVLDTPEQVESKIPEMDKI